VSYETFVERGDAAPMPASAFHAVFAHCEPAEPA
jgi:hypothetical protein